MIEVYVRDVRRALSHECWFAALSLALALPDICGMIEFPDATVSDRYIGWFDRYVSKHLDLDNIDDHVPCVSGEVVYNLRNTFLHQGTPTIQSDKVKQARNRIDRFGLVLGDGSVIHTMASTINMRDVWIRTLFVDVTYLCTAICDCALFYYQNNREGFQFEYNVFPQDIFWGENNLQNETERNNDPVGTALQTKLIEAGHRVHINDNVTDKLSDSLSQAGITMNPVNSRHAEVSPKSEKKSETAQVKARKTLSEDKAKREHQLRCFFGEHFKEEKYKRKKEDILKAVLTARTKTQLNANLMKLFPGADVKIILTRLKPLTGNWPGQ